MVKYFSKHLLLKAFSMCCSLQPRHTVSQPHKRADEILSKDVISDTVLLNKAHVIFLL
jgi:hypothetical protein